MQGFPPGYLREGWASQIRGSCSYCVPVKPHFGLRTTNWNTEGCDTILAPCPAAWGHRATQSLGWSQMPTWSYPTLPAYSATIGTIEDPESVWRGEWSFLFILSYSSRGGGKLSFPTEVLDNSQSHVYRYSVRISGLGPCCCRRSRSIRLLPTPSPVLTGLSIARRQMLKM